MSTSDRNFPGYPPEDYEGQLSDWMVELQSRGLWDGQGWYGDVMLTEREYTEILDKCES